MHGENLSTLAVLTIFPIDNCKNLSISLSPFLDAFATFPISCWRKKSQYVTKNGDDTTRYSIVMFHYNSIPKWTGGLSSWTV
jgi:hypothetical protein